MRRSRFVAWAGLPIVIGLIFLGIARLGSADPAPQPNYPKTPIPNPDAGLTEAEIRSKHAQLKAQGDARQEAWLKEFVRKGRDVRSLPRSELMVEFFDSEPDLTSAVRHADLIVVGSVQSVQFAVGNAIPTTTATFAVERTIKGTGTRNITLLQIGGPSPHADFTEAHLAYAPDRPLLLPGDRAVLFLLAEAGRPGVFSVQPYAGTYESRNGRIMALENNRFRASVDGMSEAAFINAVTQLVPQ